jgi:hypothetical protein
MNPGFIAQALKTSILRVAMIAMRTILLFRLALTVP